MKVELGNDHALDLLDGQFVPKEGEFVTTFTMPDDMATTMVLMNVLDALPYHLQKDTKPAWIKSDSATIEKLLREHFGVTKSRPREWGKKDQS